MFPIGFRPLFDSRKLIAPAQTVFVALETSKNDGHQFIAQLYQKGVRKFLISKRLDIFNTCPEADFHQSHSPLRSLQDWASAHRQRFSLPVVAITGSNGKTIVKEWLYQLLDESFSIIKSPKSYNSQLGVPVSVLEMQAHHQLGIFEAGISQPGEMPALARIIQPTIGIFTNIGQAHSEHFESLQQKIAEKLQLFVQAKILIYPTEQADLHHFIQSKKTDLNCQIYDWGQYPDARVKIQPIGQNTYAVDFEGNKFELVLGFSDKASVENCMNALVAALVLGADIPILQKRVLELRNIPMRLQRKEANRDCILIDDSYNNDLAGLGISLEFLQQQTASNPNWDKALILSDLANIPDADSQTYPLVAEWVKNTGIKTFVGVGHQLSQARGLFEHEGIKTYFFEDATALSAHLNTHSDFFQKSAILVKGARKFGLERVVAQLQKRLHETVLSIDLSALAYNFRFFKQLVAPHTKLMAMVKAFAYGGGIREIAQTLAYYRVDYFGVAYPDEGVVLRQAGILDVPIMVMNPNPASFEQLRQFRLEPAVSNWAILEALIAYLSPLRLAPFPIQLEIDTGMRRLGFEAKDTALLLDFLEKAQNVVKVVGIFSHLASSEAAQDDAFTLQQFALFEEFTNLYERRFGAVCKHMLNSSGIVRWAQKSYDMVRFGIGLYGIDATLSYSNELQTVASLQTVISQIKTLNPSESVGYNRRGRTSTPTRVATIAIGYADGFLRAFGHGRGFVWVNGCVCPTIGTVCMDMAFVDLGDTPAEVGDAVQIFGKDLPIESVAQYIGTIPYEILTNISERVPRVFYE